MDGPRKAAPSGRNAHRDRRRRAGYTLTEMLVALALVALAVALGTQILASAGEGWRRISGAAREMEAAAQTGRMLDRFASRTEHAREGGVIIEEDGRVVLNRRGDRLAVEPSDGATRLTYSEAGAGAVFAATLPGGEAWRFAFVTGPGGVRLRLASQGPTSHAFSTRLRIAAPAICRYDPGARLCLEAEMSP